MNLEVSGRPAFSHIHVELQPGESINAESGAMASMDADLDMGVKMNGGFFGAIMKRFLGNESFFLSNFSNNTSSSQKLVLTQATPGDMIAMDLNNESFCLQPGAYICAEPGVKLGLKWAGFASLIAREGLFKLEVSGSGKVVFGAFGALVEKEVDGEYIVDTSHLVGYSPNLKLKTQLSGGIFSSFFSGEGFVTRIEGKGKIIVQSRSLDGFAGLVNRFFY